MLLKVYGGTPVQEGDSLCETCRHARIARGRRLEDELVVCGALVMDAVRITFKVKSCTEYVDDREPTYHVCSRRRGSCGRRRSGAPRGSFDPRT